MRLGVTLATLVSEARTEAELSAAPAAGTGAIARTKQKINSVYRALYDDFDWPHLRRTFDRITLAAGTRYYDIPSDLNIGRIEQEMAWWGGEPHPIYQGIGELEFSSFDSENDERADPVLKYDFRDVSGTIKLEVWPLPASSGNEVQFIGIRTIPALVNDADTCLLDADVVVLTVAAELCASTDEKLSARLDGRAGRRLADLRARVPAREQVRLGLGGVDGGGLRPYNAVVRVGRN